MELASPLEANVNIHGTAFAGSIYSAAVLAGWAWTEAHVRRHSLPASVVLKSAHVRYKAPLKEGFVCVAQPASAEELEAFACDFSERHKATLPLKVLVFPSSALGVDGKFTIRPACEMLGEYTAVGHVTAHGGS